jgi:hypothetical protein
MNRRHVDAIMMHLGALPSFVNAPSAGTSSWSKLGQSSFAPDTKA